MMLDSHEAVVNYMMPLGLHHILHGDIIMAPNRGAVFPAPVPTGFRPTITKPINEE